MIYMNKKIPLQNSHARGGTNACGNMMKENHKKQTYVIQLVQELN